MWGTQRDLEIIESLLDEKSRVYLKEFYEELTLDLLERVNRIIQLNPKDVDFSSLIGFCLFQVNKSAEQGNT